MASRETTHGRQEGSLAQYASVAGVGLNFGSLTQTHTPLFILGILKYIQFGENFLGDN